MAHYFMHLRDGAQELLDPEGREFPTLEALRAAVLFTARDLVTGDVRNGFIDLRHRIDAHDDGGAIVHSLGFKHAVNIIGEGDSGPSSLAA